MGEKRAIAGAIIGSVVCVGAAWGFLASQSGCQLQTCISSSLTANSSTSGYQPTVQNGVWQSGPINGAAGWIQFKGNTSYSIYPTLDDGGAFPGPYVPYALVSADPNPYTNGYGSNFAQSAGNIAEFAGIGTNGISVLNDTCSDYFLWLQITQANAQPDAAPTPLDASADGPTSAASDASPDASPVDASDASMTSSDASNPDATGD